MTDIIQWLLIAVSIPLIVAMVLQTIKRARVLSERIDEYHESQEAQSQQPGPIDPYANIAEIFAPKPEDENGKKTE